MEESMEPIQYMQSTQNDEESNSNYPPEESDCVRENFEPEIVDKREVENERLRDTCEEERLRTEEMNIDYIRENIQTIEKEEYRYVGELKNELRDGFGICYYKNGDIYKGQWKNDLREGLGMLIYSNGDIMQGELKDDVFIGFCEKITNDKKFSIKGNFTHYHNNFVDYVIVKNNNKIFEGEAVRDPNFSNISIGKLTTIKHKKTQKIFLGEVLDYKEECGCGIFIVNTCQTISSNKVPVDDKKSGSNYKKSNSEASKNKKSNSSKDTNASATTSATVTEKSEKDKNPEKNFILTMYQGFIRNKNFEKYLEMYSLDGTASFFNIENGKKNGISISFTKDGKVVFGLAKNNYKQGPFITFSNSHNLPKSSIRMEIYFQDFKCKVVDKMETSKKYLAMYYPEYMHIFDFNYTEVISKLNDVLNVEVPYFNKLVADKYEVTNNI